MRYYSEVKQDAKVRKSGWTVVPLKATESNWVYGGVLCGSGDHSIIYQTEPDIEKKVVYTDTIGQFTGQYDANKKKIYEGDIIQYDGDYDEIDGFTRSFSEKAIVLWDEDYCGFVCKVIGDESGDSYSWLEYRENPDLTIIGNIYDNPELVRGTENDTST